MLRRSNRMIFLVFIMVFVVCAILVANVFSVTVLSIHVRSGTDISQYSNESSIRTEIIKANRGIIYDSKGNIIAQDIESYNILFYLSDSRMAAGNKPAYVTDPVATARILSSILEVEEEVLLSYLTKTDVYQTEIGNKGRNLSLETKNTIEELGLPGVEFYETTTRFYPQGAFASHTIGFAQYDVESNTLIGRMGLEEIYEEELAGTDGYIQYVSNKAGYRLPGAQVTTEAAELGNNLYLTINKQIQLAVEESLSESMNKFNTTKAWAGVMEVETGKILALAGYPTFDANTLEIADYTNLATQYIYEPGSTMKTFTYAAAIDSGVYDGGAYFDSSPYKMGISGGRAVRVQGDNYIEVINNARGRNWGYISYDTGFRYSSNVAIAQLLTDYLNPAVFEDYLEKFGFFVPVGVDGLPEGSGKKNFTYPIEKLTTGFGQGSSVTMLQMLQAYSAIFNDGTMVKPYIVQQIKDPTTNEIIYNAETTVVSNPISSATAEKVQQLMYDVVNTEDGSGRFYALEEVAVIAKTGTAEIYQSGTYDNNKVIVSIALAFPADDPKIMIYYAFECDYSNQVHTDTEPIKSLILKTALEYNLIHTSIDHSEEEEGEFHQVEKYLMPALVNHSLSYVENKLDAYQNEIIILGSGKQVVKQYPAAGEEILSNQTIILLSDSDDILMPDMSGWSRKEVLAFWSMSNIEIFMSGYGVVYEQDVLEGVLIFPDTVINLKLK